MLSLLAEQLAPAGLNLIGVADAASFSRTAEVFPAARSIVVVASGGPALWHAFVAAARSDARVLTGEKHPLDAFVRKAIDRADAALGSIARRWFFAAATSDVHLDFRTLGLIAGLGSKSRLGLLLHDEYGPWLGLRAACFVDVELPRTARPAINPCDECPGYCVAACPGGAFTGGFWDVDRCSAFHVEDTRCAVACHSRAACPIGAVHAYPEEERAYHYNRAEGRRRLREQLGIDPRTDNFQGEGPYWVSWREKIAGAKQ